LNPSEKWYGLEAAALRFFGSRVKAGGDFHLDELAQKTD
jgi:hypothetical protein